MKLRLEHVAQITEPDRIDSRFNPGNAIIGPFVTIRFGYLDEIGVGDLEGARALLAVAQDAVRLLEAVENGADPREICRAEREAGR